ncbi:hypothetical protein M1349_01910 [Patescibacteria group bacterium]|nr:hypothetical protein [Patescibacteria group bacterium]
MSEGPKIPSSKSVSERRSSNSNVYDIDTGIQLTKREVAAEVRSRKTSEPQRQIGRRFIDTTFGKLTAGIGIIATAAGLGTVAKGALDGKSAEQEFSQRPIAASGIEPGNSTIKSETKSPEDIPDMFIPGKTSFDLTEINIRSSTYNGNEHENYNKIDSSQIEEIESVPFDQEAKTLIVENAKLFEGTVGLGVKSRYFGAKAKLTNGTTINIYLNYDHTKEQGLVATDADETHESGFVEKDSNGKYHGEIPKLNQAPRIVNPEEMNKVSFSTSPLNSASQ